MCNLTNPAGLRKPRLTGLLAGKSETGDRQAPKFPRRHSPCSRYHRDCPVSGRRDWAHSAAGQFWEDIMDNVLRAAAMLLGVMVMGAGAARASVISDTPDPLPPGSLFVGTSGGAGCFPNLGICAGKGVLSFSNVASSFDMLGQELDFTGVLTVPFVNEMTNQPVGTVSLSGPVHETIFGRTSATELGSWMTQITALDLTGNFEGIPLEATQDTDNASTGQTTIAAAGDKFAITSFFDIFVDIELSTVPPLTTGRGPLHAELEPLPEPASLALLLLPLAGLAAVWRGVPVRYGR
jgi:hypothetical protein